MSDKPIENIVKKEPETHDTSLIMGRLPNIHKDEQMIDNTTTTTTTKNIFGKTKENLNLKSEASSEEPATAATSPPPVAAPHEQEQQPQQATKATKRGEKPVVKTEPAQRDRPTTSTASAGATGTGTGAAGQPARRTFVPNLSIDRSKREM